LARVAGVTLRWPHVVVLGASVWLAYAADRWLEGWRLHWRDIRTERHHFYQRRRWPVAAVWGLVLAIDLIVAFSGLSVDELAAGIVLLTCALMYLLSHQIVHRRRRWRAPKELCVASLLTGGVRVFLGASPIASDLTLSTALLALLYFTNCALISLWERDVDLAHGQTSLAVDFTGNRWAIRQLPFAAAVLAGAVWMAHPGPSRMAAACVLASALLLAVVDRLEDRAGEPMARVLADVALLTPVAVLYRLW
jgi:hypothetical protein